MFIFEGNEIETDSEGYLKDTTLWNEAMAAVIAEQEGISLSVEHWEVVRFVRDFYQLTKSSVDIPANERLLKGELTYDPAKIQELTFQQPFVCGNIDRTFC